jgi:predicted metalloprotease with PDZ domain
MLHLGFPNVPDRYLWIEEGLATYVEPIARCRVGLITPERVWGDLVDGLPQGEPEAGDRGLDYTHTWGRTYWGGALFCLRADVEIRRRTGNRYGLEHVLRAIHAAGGTIDQSWTLDRAIAVGDAGTGVPVLRELYNEMKAKPDKVDLPALWKQLGVVRHGQTVVFDSHAPLAAVRKAITVR